MATKQHDESFFSKKCNDFVKATQTVEERSLERNRKAKWRSNVKEVNVSWNCCLTKQNRVAAPS
jgi:hypothetical protein